MIRNKKILKGNVDWTICCSKAKLCRIRCKFLTPWSGVRIRDFKACFEKRREQPSENWMRPLFRNLWKMWQRDGFLAVWKRTAPVGLPDKENQNTKISSVWKWMGWNVVWQCLILVCSTKSNHQNQKTFVEWVSDSVSKHLHDYLLKNVYS
jgi:hypothetical protein